MARTINWNGTVPIAGGLYCLGGTDFPILNSKHVYVGTNAVDAADTSTTLYEWLENFEAAYLPTAGGIMSGNITISKQNPSLVLNDTASALSYAVIGTASDGNLRLLVQQLDSATGTPEEAQAGLVVTPYQSDPRRILQVFANDGEAGSTTNYYTFMLNGLPVETPLVINPQTPEAGTAYNSGHSASMSMYGPTRSNTNTQSHTGIRHDAVSDYTYIANETYSTNESAYSINQLLLAPSANGLDKNVLQIQRVTKTATGDPVSTSVPVWHDGMLPDIMDKLGLNDATTNREVSMTFGAYHGTSTSSAFGPSNMMTHDFSTELGNKAPLAVLLFHADLHFPNAYENEARYSPAICMRGSPWAHFVGQETACADVRTLWTDTTMSWYLTNTNSSSDPAKMFNDKGKTYYYIAFGKTINEPTPVPTANPTYVAHLEIPLTTTSSSEYVQPSELPGSGWQTICAPIDYFEFSRYIHACESKLTLAGTLMPSDLSQIAGQAIYTVAARDGTQRVITVGNYITEASGYGYYWGREANGDVYNGTQAGNIAYNDLVPMAPAGMGYVLYTENPYHRLYFLNAGDYTMNYTDNNHNCRGTYHVPTTGVYCFTRDTLFDNGEGYTTESPLMFEW